MDTTDNNPTPSRLPPAPAPGGTVEPANRATIAKERFQTVAENPSERFELRDPFAEVTYRSDSFPDMVEKADHLGSSRFIAVDQQGKRTTVQKVDGKWHRGPKRPAALEWPADTSPVREVISPSQATNVVPMSPTAPQVETVEAKVNANPSKVSHVEAQAERAARVVQIEATLMDRYVVKRAPVTVGDVTIGHTEYRFRGDTSRVAFTESTFKLATDTNSPSVARSMVDVAEARNWRGLRVSGNEEFKRMVWLEASVRGVKAIGYEPTAVDRDVLNKEREARLVNRIEPARADTAVSAATPAEKASARGGGGRKTVLAAIEAVLIAKHVPEKQREAVMAAATEKLAQRLREGQSFRVKVYDKAAPSRRPTMTPIPEQQRNRDRAAPAR